MILQKLLPGAYALCLCPYPDSATTHLDSPSPPLVFDLKHSLLKDEERARAHIEARGEVAMKQVGCQDMQRDALVFFAVISCNILPMSSTDTTCEQEKAMRARAKAELTKQGVKK